MKSYNILQREEAITCVKDTFSKQLKQVLELTHVSSPLAILDGTGINDDLNGIERPVSFPVKALAEKRAVVVHSLAKWKRLRIQQLGIEEGKGILTDMRALRPDEDYTALHSIYVDQWDWEKRISKTDRTLSLLKNTVHAIYGALKQTEQHISSNYPDIESILPEKITFIHAEELLRRYPKLTPKQREIAFTKEHKAVFIIGVGSELSDGKPHDGRAPDYDDWSTKNEDGFAGLNGDILVWHPITKTAFELSSMGVRVDKETLVRQLKQRQCMDKAKLAFHQMLLQGKLPQTIGGGIGQSRLCMFMLKMAHIGEVQVGVWSEQERQRLEHEEGVVLL